MTGENIKLTVYAALGGCCPIFMLWFSTAISSNSVFTLDSVYITFLAVSAIVGVLVFWLVSESRKLSAFLCGISAPGLLFALTAGTRVGGDLSQKDQFTLSPIVEAFTSRAFAEDGIKNVKSCFRGRHFTIADMENAELDVSGLIREKLKYFHFSVNPKMPIDAAALRDNPLLTVVNFVNEDSEEFSCTIVYHGGPVSLLSVADISSVSIETKNGPQIYLNSESGDAFYAEVEFEISGFDEVWWRLGGGITGTPILSEATFKNSSSSITD